MAKRNLGPLALPFTCTGSCGKLTQAAKGSVLELLRLCDPCQQVRFAAGMKRQEAALAQEAAGVPRG